jgi:hypothetical protein
LRFPKEKRGFPTGKKENPIGTSAFPIGYNEYPLVKALLPQRNCEKPNGNWLFIDAPPLFQKEIWKNTTKKKEPK